MDAWPYEEGSFQKWKSNSSLYDYLTVNVECCLPRLRAPHTLSSSSTLQLTIRHIYPEPALQAGSSFKFFSLHSFA